MSRRQALQQAAIMAEEFALTHKRVFVWGHESSPDSVEDRVRDGPTYQA